MINRIPSVIADEKTAELWSLRCHVRSVRPFAVIPGAQVHEVLDGRAPEVVGLIESAYRVHGEGGTVNPPSYFLRFPDRPTSRIIALPASIGEGLRSTD